MLTDKAPAIVGHHKFKANLEDDSNLFYCRFLSIAVSCVSCESDRMVAADYINKRPHKPYLEVGDESTSATLYSAIDVFISRKITVSFVPYNRSE